MMNSLTSESQDTSLQGSRRRCGRDARVIVAKELQVEDWVLDCLQLMGLTEVGAWETNGQLTPGQTEPLQRTDGERGKNTLRPSALGPVAHAASIVSS